MPKLLLKSVLISCIFGLHSHAQIYASSPDLEIFALDESHLQAQDPTRGWMLSKAIKNDSDIIHLDCKGFRYFGNVEFSNQMSIFRLFENLPTHTHVRVQFEVIFIDEWDPEEKIVFKIGNQTRSERKRGNHPQDMQLCGDPALKDAKHIFFDQIKHTGKSLLIEIKDTTKLGYWGIANFRLQT